MNQQKIPEVLFQSSRSKKTFQVDSYIRISNSRNYTFYLYLVTILNKPFFISLRGLRMGSGGKSRVTTSLTPVKSNIDTQIYPISLC